MRISSSTVLLHSASTLATRMALVGSLLRVGRVVRGVPLSMSRTLQEYLDGPTPDRLTVGDVGFRKEPDEEEDEEDDEGDRNEDDEDEDPDDGYSE